MRAAQPDPSTLLAAWENSFLNLSRRAEILCYQFGDLALGSAAATLSGRHDVAPEEGMQPVSGEMKRQFLGYGFHIKVGAVFSGVGNLFQEGIGAVDVSLVMFEIVNPHLVYRNMRFQVCVTVNQCRERINFCCHLVSFIYELFESGIYL